MTAARCLTDEEIAALAERGLLSAEAPRVDAHLSECAACRRLVSEAVTSAMPADAESPASKDPFTLPDVDPARYEIGREIARGGMGRILEAWDVRHRRRVAMKVVLRGVGSAAERFTREVRVLSRLQHPSIVPLYEAGRFPDGEQFFAMRLVAGTSLAEAIARAPRPADRLALVPHLLAVADALAYAHAQHVVHRDLKPSNVLVGGFGETLVIDWGLAKELVADENHPASSMAMEGPARPRGDRARALETRPGQALGTPCYMPPEQARGEAADPRADVYAIGAMLYHVVTGAPPYEAASAEIVIASVLAAPPPGLAETAHAGPADLAALVDKAMARDPSARYANARELADDLRRFVSGQRVAAYRYSPLALGRRWVSRHRAAVVIGAALAVSLSVTVTLGARRSAKDATNAPEEARPVLATTAVLAATAPPPTSSDTPTAPASVTPAQDAATPPPAPLPSAAPKPLPIRKATGGPTGRCGGGDYGGVVESSDMCGSAARIQGAINACFARSEYDPEDHHVVSYTVTVDASGTVLQAVRGAGNLDAKLDACMEAALRTMRVGTVINGKGGVLSYLFGSRPRDQ